MVLGAITGAFLEHRQSKKKNETEIEQGDIEKAKRQILENLDNIFYIDNDKATSIINRVAALKKKEIVFWAVEQTNILKQTIEDIKKVKLGSEEYYKLINKKQRVYTIISKVFDLKNLMYAESDFKEPSTSKDEEGEKMFVVIDIENNIKDIKNRIVNWSEEDVKKIIEKIRRMDNMEDVYVLADRFGVMSDRINILVDQGMFPQRQDERSISILKKNIKKDLEAINSLLEMRLVIDWE